MLRMVWIALGTALALWGAWLLFVMVVRWVTQD